MTYGNVQLCEAVLENVPSLLCYAHVHLTVVGLQDTQKTQFKTGTPTSTMHNGQGRTRRNLCIAM